MAKDDGSRWHQHCLKWPQDGIVASRRRKMASGLKIEGGKGRWENGQKRCPPCTDGNHQKNQHTLAELDSQRDWNLVIFHQTTNPISHPARKTLKLSIGLRKCRSSNLTSNSQQSLQPKRLFMIFLLGSQVFNKSVGCVASGSWLLF